MRLAYYSSATGNTARFVEKLGLPATRIAPGAPPAMDRPFVLLTPTFADGEGRGAVPKPVIRFLNIAQNRAHIVGVIAGGNRNFGKTFALAGDVIAAKCGVPCLYRFELAGTAGDVERTRQGLERSWTQLCSTAA